MASARGQNGKFPVLITHRNVGFTMAPGPKYFMRVLDLVKKL